MDKLLIRPLIAVLISLLIPARSYRRKSLDPSGAIAGFAVITIQTAVVYRYGSLLLVFFFTSSKLTKVGEDKKRRVDADLKDVGQRNWVQVLSNSGIASILVLVLWAKSVLRRNAWTRKTRFLLRRLLVGLLVTMLVAMATLGLLSWECSASIDHDSQACYQWRSYESRTTGSCRLCYRTDICGFWISHYKMRI